MVTKHLRISGIVQGVSYRDWTVLRARELGLTGWVRNRRDGSVEALIMGEENKVEALIKACHDGPAYARVDHIDVEDDIPEKCENFERRDTA